MFSFLTRAVNAVGRALKPRPAAQPTAKKARPRVESLEDRMVPAHIQPVHEVSNAMQTEFRNGQASRVSGNFTDARMSFDIVYAQATERRDADMLLDLAIEYRRLGDAAGASYGDYLQVKQAYESAIWSAEYWAVYKPGLRESGNDRAYGISMLNESLRLYPEVQKTKPAQWDLETAKNGALRSLNELNNQTIFDILQGNWVNDAGTKVGFTSPDSSPFGLPAKAFVWMLEGTTSTGLRPAHVAQRTPNVSVVKDGAWNVHPAEFTITFNNTTVWFDPKDSGRLVIRNNGTGVSYEVYRSWDQADDPNGGLDIGKLLDALNKMTPAQAAKELQQYDMTVRVTALDLMTPRRASQVIWAYNWGDLISTLNHMTAKRASQVIWNYNWTDFMATLDRMTAKRASQVIWNYNWTGVMNTLNRMTPQRVSQVIWNYDRNDRIATLDRMTPGRVGKVIWSYNWGDMLDTLNHMSSTRASQVLWTYSWSDLINTLNRLSSLRVAQVISHFSADGVMGSLNRMAPARAAEVIWHYKMEGRINVLNRMTVVRAADVLKTYEYSQRIELLNHMTATRRKQLMLALGM